MLLLLLRSIVPSALMTQSPPPHHLPLTTCEDLLPAPGHRRDIIVADVQRAQSHHDCDELGDHGQAVVTEV